MCGRDAIVTQYDDVVVFIEEGQGYLQSVNAEATSEEDLLEPLESRIVAVRMSHNMTQEDKIRKLQWSICEEKRRILMKSLEHARNANNMEDLSRSYGRGRLVARAGAAMYVTECVGVQVQHRTTEVCTHDIPVINEEKKMFVDPVIYVLKVNTSGQCTKGRILRWKLGKILCCASPNYAHCNLDIISHETGPDSEGL